MTARCRIILLLCSLPAFTAFSQTSSSFNADSVFFEGLRLYRAEETAAARRVFRWLLNFYPRYHDARILYGRLLSWDGEYAASVVQFDSVLYFQPGNREARFAKAQVYAWSKRYRSAADILHALTEEAPNSASYWLQLANVYFWGGSPRRSLEFYEKAYLRDPLSIDVLRGLARVHRRLQSYELSLRWYRKLLERVPDDREAQTEIFRQAYASTHEVQLLGMFESFTREAVTDHTTAQLEYYLTVNEDWKPYLHVSRVARFSDQEIRYGIGSYVSLTYDIAAFTQILLAPDAQVVPELDALVDISAPVTSKLEVTAGYRYLQFRSVQVHIPSPAATLYLSPEIWLAVRGYFGITSQQTSSSAATLTLFYHPSPTTTFRVGGFTGNEAFRATTFQEVSTLRSSGGFVGVKTRVSKPIAIDIQYQFTSRNLPANSHLVQLTTSLLF